MDTHGHLHLNIETPHVVACGISDPGRLNPDNQDAILIDPGGNFMLLADGMGGHECGAEASHTTLDIIQTFLQPEVLSEKLRDITEVEGVPSKVVCLHALVGDAIERANTVLFERNRQANRARYMGTTVVGLVRIDTDYMLWFHVGDSRLYRWRTAALTCLTTDHSVFTRWVKNGRLGPEPEKNVITRAIGPQAFTSGDIQWAPQAAADVYLLCSDGLIDMLSEADIGRLIAENRDVHTIAANLIAAANAAGGKDNVSVVVCRI